MDPGGSSSGVAVSDDGSKSLVSSSSFPTQPAPIAVMMQQAIAMQQFQFQQALLMQQVMASQQAAARAATVKSATEMAAARAAEISKMLQWSGVEEENAKAVDQSAKRSKSRSRSRSLSSSQLRSGSRSRSKSRSRSRSPLRYRRGRSRSGSPNRYRNNHYSPSNYRNYYGYRGRGRGRYRGYYRGGRGDYGRGYYRRDWNQYRSDYHPHGHRRSRSRSRSLSRNRAGRRSRTHSGSPRHHRSGSLSPKHRGEHHLAAHRSRRSRSKEPKWSTSRSRSSSISKGKRPRKENSNRSKGKVSPKSNSRDDSDHQEDQSDVLKTESQVGRKRLGDPTRLERDIRAEDVEHKELAESPLQSLSVSLHTSSTNVGEENVEEDADSARHNKQSRGYVTGVYPGTKADLSTFGVGGQVSSFVQHQADVLGIDEWSPDKYGGKFVDAPFNVLECKKESPGLAERGKIAEQTGNFKSSEDEIGDGKELDDWHDDAKAYLNEKAWMKGSRKEASIKEDKSLTKAVMSKAKDLEVKHAQQHLMDIQEEIDQSRREIDQFTVSDVKMLPAMSYEGHVEQGPSSDVHCGLHKKKYPAENAGNKGFKQPELYHTNSRNQRSEEEYEEDMSVSNDSGAGGMAPGCDLSHGVREDLIYEGPAIGTNEIKYDLQQKIKSKHAQIIESVEEHEEDCSQNQTCMGELKCHSDRENVEHNTSIKHSPHDEYGSHIHGGREASTAREEIRRGDESFEKLRVRHKKHRRKHRHQNSLEHDGGIGEDANDGAVECEGSRGKKHHSRKHRRDDEERRERKKKRHKN